MIKIFNNTTNTLICTVNGVREAARFVASRENIQNIYPIEKMILDCLSLNKPLQNYRFKIEEK